MARIYLSGDQIEEAREAIRTGTTVLHVASQLGLTVQELNILLGRPQWRQIPEPQAATSSARVDLWAGEDQL